jgi:hypothetical protein
MGYNALAWLIARIQLQRLAATHRGTLMLPHMPHEAAATPTPQDD